MMRFIQKMSVTMMILAVVATAAAGTEISGFVQGLYGYGSDRNNPVPSELTASEVRLQMRLESYSDAAEYFGRLDFVYDDYLEPEYRMILREGYLKFSVGSNVDMKIGRQVITWGTGDLIFINDLFPKDYQSFFAGRDDQYLKSPQNAVRATFYGGPGSLDIVYTPRFAPDITPTGERFSYYNPMEGGYVGGEGFIMDPALPDAEVANGEVAARYSKYIGTIDAALYYYRGFYKGPVGMAPDPADPATMTAFYPGLQVFGASLRSPVLGGVFWTEGGYYDSLDDSEGDDPFIPNSSIQSLVGFERAVNQSFTANIQYQNIMITDHDRYLETLPMGMNEEDEMYHLLTSRMTMLFLMETLNVSLFGFYSPSEEDFYGRMAVSYRFTDEVTMVVGANVFESADPWTKFGMFDRNDNVYMKFTYGL
ncbi:MAG: hypothetical protein KAV42_09055 [Candidatus Krumholzibacteria bacterium]|nr:hypothetical protein [Candidatus Krumholzibacteria bacterium]